MNALLNRLFPGLEQFGFLASAEKPVLRKAIGEVREVRADRDVAHEGDRPTRHILILEGFASRYQPPSDGRRHTIAGDLCDTVSFLLSKSKPHHG